MPDPRLIIAGVVALFIAGLLSWALIEHSRVLKRDVTIAEQKGKLEGLGVEIKHQNDAIAQLQDTAAKKIAEAKTALAALADKEAEHAAEKERLRKLAAARKASGKKTGYEEAWADIMESRRK